MKDVFGQIIGDVVVDVLRFQDEVKSSRNLDVATTRRRFIDRINTAERQATESGCGSEFVLAKAALVCWIDEMVILHGLKPPQNDLFRDVCLELEFYPQFHPFAIRPPYQKEHPVEGSELFFRLADQAGRDALDVFLICVALGFRGKYSEPEDQPQLRLWIDRTDKEIRKRAADDPARSLDSKYRSNPRAIDELRPLFGQHFELGVSGLVLVASALTLITLIVAICQKSY